jgi:proteic killer suppression protein
MIKTIKNKGLQLLWENDDNSKLPAAQLKKISLLLQIIDDLEEVPQDVATFASIGRIH